MTGAAPAEEHVQVTVDDVLFRSDDGRFAVVRATRDGSGAPLVAVGDLGAVAPGETLRLAGRATVHPTHGPLFVVSSFHLVMPTTSDGLTRYLGSGLVGGIGPALAERIVGRFGARTLDVIATDSGRLTEVPGIGAKRARAIAEALRTRRAEAESLSFLHGLGLGPALARRALKRLGPDAVRRVREDPYDAASRVPGIGFLTADRMGAALGMPPDDPRRTAGAVVHALGVAADEGHACVDRGALAEAVRALAVPVAALAQVLEDLARGGRVVLEEELVYERALWEDEARLAACLSRLLARPEPVGPGPRAGEPGAADLAPRQREAVHAALRHGLFVLTGGPGTGKTTTVRAIVRAVEGRGQRIELAAPTGRAAKRLSEATGAEARTLHRLLEWNPQTGRFTRDRENPLDADVVLVDEASMLNLPLAARLGDALPPTASLVLVGDADQLPPVGPGHVLRELLSSGRVPTVRLTEIFRQAAESAIVRGAHAILAGELPTPTARGARGTGDLFILAEREPARVHERLLASLERIRSSYGLDPLHDVQVLSPMRRGPLGTEQLNLLLQAHLNPRAAGSAPGALRPGDKVMQLRNDYDRDVFNGDLGEVRTLERGEVTVAFDGRPVAYGAEDLDALALAYASTVHKVQGSEFPAVIVVVGAEHHVLLSRPLLYTAVTRARRLVVLLGDPRAMARAAANATATATRSRLAARLGVAQPS